MANKKKIPARALACLLSTAMVPGSLPMDGCAYCLWSRSRRVLRRKDKRSGYHTT